MPILMLTSTKSNDRRHSLRPLVTGQGIRIPQSLISVTVSPSDGFVLRVQAPSVRVSTDTDTDTSTTDSSSSSQAKAGRSASATV